MSRSGELRRAYAWLIGIAWLAALGGLAVLLLKVLHWGPVVVVGTVVLVAFLSFGEWRSRNQPLTRRLEDGHSTVPIPTELRGPTWGRDTSDAGEDRSRSDHP